MREHGATTAGELAALGIMNPFEEIAEQILRAHTEGEVTDDELRGLGIGRGPNGELVIATSDLGTIKPAGHG